MNRVVLPPSQTLRAIHQRLQMQPTHGDPVSALEALYAAGIVERLARLINGGKMTSVASRRLLQTVDACVEGRVAWKLLHALVAREARAVCHSTASQQQLAEELAAAAVGVAVAGAIEDLLSRARQVRDGKAPLTHERERERHLNDVLDRTGRLLQALAQLTGAALTAEEARLLEHGAREVVSLADNRLYAGTAFAAAMGVLFRTRRLAAA
ncbi:MAG: hypothetical protein VKO21_07125 [Candidatus Sericytochromatia bacterium]|nr:hypothetical protein [Candidatus Sericytochromatia bacterium]